MLCDTSVGGCAVWGQLTLGAIQQVLQGKTHQLVHSAVLPYEQAQGIPHDAASDDKAGSSLLAHGHADMPYMDSMPCADHSNGREKQAFCGLGSNLMTT